MSGSGAVGLRSPKLSRRSILGGAASLPLAARAAERPRAAGDGRLNLIEIVFDTVSRHYIGCYGAEGFYTPNFDRLAAKGLRMLDAYPEIMPTIPIRRVLYTGRRAFPGDVVPQPDDSATFRGWHPLYVEDVTQAETLRNAGYTTAIVCDTFHLWKPGKNFGRGFDGVRWIRGQENDAYATGPAEVLNVADFLHASQYRGPEEEGTRYLIRRYLNSRATWRNEDDWPTARLFEDARNWLDLNITRSQPFYLHIESYSPHEYWDPPPDYYEAFMRGNYSGPRLINSPGDGNLLTPLEREHVVALYKGLLAYADRRLGFFLDKVEELGLLDNTIILLTADHGTFLGQSNNMFHKGEGSQRTQLTNVPMIFYHPRHPEWAGKTLSGFVQHTDVMPTLLDLLGVGTPERATGQSFAPNLEAMDTIHKEYIAGGWGDHGYVRTPELLRIARWNTAAGTPANTYDELYDLKKDPQELSNVIQNNSAAAEDLRLKLMAYVEAGREFTQGTWQRISNPAFK